MEFQMNEETIMLKESVARFLKEKVSSNLIKELVKGDKGYSESLWKEMAQLGWLGLIFEESYGGSGTAFFDICILFEEIGKSGLSSPFYCSAILCGMIVNETGDTDLKNAYLPAIAQGEKILTLAVVNEEGQYDYSVPDLSAKKSGDSYILNGTRLLVPYASVADEILVCAKVNGTKTRGPTLFKISPKVTGLKMTPLNPMRLEKIFAVYFENVEVSEKDILGSIGEGAMIIEAILPKAIIIKCSEMLGGMERVRDMTVEYMKQRIQFGRPLGALQAVQHHCADIATLTETSRMLVYRAASLLGEGIACDKEISMAKAWCSDAFKKSTQIAHQLHGGIGFTEEHDLHIFYRNGKVSEYEFGDSWLHRNKVADAMGL